MACAGIHFGNTNSVIAVLKDGHAETVANEMGDRVTPSIVAYTGTEKVVGLPAKQYLIRYPQSCISHIKATIGQSFSDEHIRQVKSRCSCQVANEHGTISFVVQVGDLDVNVLPVDAASFVFTKLLEDAEKVGGDELEDAVLAVPKHFTEEQRIALCEAAENVGFNVIRIISEPAAALLAYGIGQEDPAVVCSVLVFRLGGSSMDASLVEVNSGMYRIVASRYDNTFGCSNFDQALLKFCCDEFHRKYKIDPSESKRAIGKLLSAVEQCKQSLSQTMATEVAVDSLIEGVDYHSQIARVKFELSCAEHFRRCDQFVSDLLKDANYTVDRITKIVLVGGGTRIPRLQQLFKDRFPYGEVLNSIPPEEVIARGAALQGGIVQGRDDIVLNANTLCIDCVSKNIGIQVSVEVPVALLLPNMHVEIDDGLANDSLDIVIPKNTPVPTRRTRSFDVRADQSAVLVRLHESDSDSVSCSTLLAQIVLKDLPSDCCKQILSSFEISRNGDLLVSLCEPKSNKRESISIPIRAA